MKRSIGGLVTTLIYNDDCLNALKNLPENSIDSLITDPPAGISFMGKSWDDDKGGRDNWIAWLSSSMKEAHRVLKPGAYGLVWAIPRTSHWTGKALEDAGFNVRDVITHLFGSGFPKSHNISKAIDKKFGADREVIGRKPGDRYKYEFNSDFNPEQVKSRLGSGDAGLLTAPSTPEAKQWEGFGSSLKPAAEFWFLIQKPISEKTIADNVLTHGVGGLNIDACRIGIEQRINKGVPSYQGRTGTFSGQGEVPTRSDKPCIGRFPANLVLSHHPECKLDEQCVDECAVKLLDEQSGVLHPSGNKKISKAGKTKKSMFGIGSVEGRASDYKDLGGASRFFYCAKVSTSERNKGCDGLPKKPTYLESTATPQRDKREQVNRGNHHPTVKPLKLMTYLITLITPPGGTVLDPFMGSGSTGVAAVEKGFKFIGIEKEEEYFKIAEARIKATSLA